MLASIVQILGRFIRVDDATIRGKHCIFAHVCIEIDLMLPLKRILVLHPHDGSEKPSIIWVSYEALFKICCLCGNFTQRFEAYPTRVMERHLLTVDRMHDEHAIYPPKMQGVEGVQQFVSNGSMVFFPQPFTTYANVVNGGHGTQATHDADDSEQSSPTWIAVSRAHNRDFMRNSNGRGGTKPTVGTRALRFNEPAAHSVPSSPLNAGNEARAGISLRERQVDDNNIIILPNSIEELIQPLLLATPTKI
ncbi:hypothetical protein M0R45_016574 [Rubus argutus]|uniref:Uncharacterized protein n=1 Tax=Rubus argutus TaxID=59490 RepID=A0AAW1XTH4_RUBAR